MNVRTYRVAVRGFDFDHVHVRARSRGRARTICAEAFEDAGWGSRLEGYRSIASTRLDAVAVELLYPRRGPEGFARVLGDSRDRCPVTALPCDRRCPDPDCARLHLSEKDGNT